MRYAALSDLHLGYRGNGRMVAGRNQRELDVEAAWYEAVQRIMAEKPDLCLIAGDCFHSVRPSFHAVRAFQDGVHAMWEEGIDVVIIGGNHESPRTVETLTPNVVARPNAYVLTKPEQILIQTRGREMVAVSCLPFVGLGEEQVYNVEPNPVADVNVLLIHAAVQTSAVAGALPPVYGGAAAYDVGREAERWDVIACGDFHEFRRLHPTRAAFYSGSIERTSSNIWQEHAPKGFVLGDTSTGAIEFVEIPTRPMADYDLGDFDLPPGAGAEDVNQCLARMLDPDFPYTDALVRFKVDSFPRGERDAIDWRLVDCLKEKHVHFLLDLRVAEREALDLGDRRERTSRTLADEASDFFAEDDEAVRAAAFGFLGLEQPHAAEVG